MPNCARFVVLIDVLPENKGTSYAFAIEDKQRASKNTHKNIDPLHRISFLSVIDEQLLFLLIMHCIYTFDFALVLFILLWLTDIAMQCRAPVHVYGASFVIVFLSFVLLIRLVMLHCFVYIHLDLI